MALYIDGQKVINPSSMDFSNNGTITTLLGTSGDYNRIGDAGTTGHSLNSEDDLLVTGDLEVDGSLFSDGALLIGDPAAFSGNLIVRKDASGSSNIVMTLANHDATNNNDIILEFSGKDDGGGLDAFGRFDVNISNHASGSETSDFELALKNSGSWNAVLKVTAPGVLSVDLAGSGAAAQVDLFDDYDDAMVLYRGISQRDNDSLCELGIMSKKEDGNGSGYMLNLQPMTYLLAGGVYQNRAQIDNISDRISAIEDRVGI
jgi:hypothetical protein|tara:strand:+ start:1174 stop:1953 length:780 start_codon:yes stop_codon:yes gene_type:complete